jgi:hypothetical protein
MLGTPIVLSSPIVVGAATRSMGTPSDPSALICPNQAAMLVNEIALVISSDSAPNLPHTWDISMGSIKLTENAIPPDLCCRLEDTGSGFPSGGQYYTWRFPRPFYVPKGRVITCRLMAGDNGTLATIAYRGRLLPDDYPVPATTMAPYATAFMPPAASMRVAQQGNQYVYRSGGGSLSNPFHEDLRVQRFIGVAWPQTGGIVMSGLAQNGAARFFPLVQLSDADGNPLVRDQTSLLDLCTAARGTWDTEFVLPAAHSVYATVDQQHAANLNGTNIQMGLSMVGWHSVPLSEV